MGHFLLGICKGHVREIEFGLLGLGITTKKKKQIKSGNSAGIRGKVDWEDTIWAKFGQGNWISKHPSPPFCATGLSEPLS